MKISMNSEFFIAHNPFLDPELFSIYGGDLNKYIRYLPNPDPKNRLYQTLI